MMHEPISVPITSDVIGKLRKIQNGTVFDSPLVFVTELFQNAYRARAKTVQITLRDDTLIFVDDGCGAGNPKTILTLDYSHWQSTDEGFGIGFWSVLGIPGIQECRITSRKWTARIDIPTLFATGTPAATVVRLPAFHHGFAVALTAPYLRDHADAIVAEIARVGALQPYTVTLNGRAIERQDVFIDVTGEFTKDFSTRLFTARLAVADRGWHSPTLYYERRTVCEYADTLGVRGIIEMKPRALTLKEPDRKQIVRDAKRETFASAISKCTRDLYRAFVRQATTDQIARYAGVIDDLLSVSEYEAYVLDDAMFAEIGGIPAPVPDDPDPFVFSTATIDRAAFDRADEDLVSPAVPAPNSHATRPRKRSVRSEIKKWKRTVWVSADELDDVRELVAKARYYGLTVVTATNVLQQNVFRKYRVPHISEIEQNLVRRHVISNVGVQTQKEARYLALLAPICQHYQVPNVFRIGKIAMTLEVRVGDQMVDRERMQVGGVVHDGVIILDRAHLALKRFRLTGGGIGQHELKALLATLPTVCHELAHLLYHTTDNTPEHFTTERNIYDELVTIYLKMR
ncbi:MAG: hypothetical protein PHR28_09015 [candidate division Zixibacteria bacterium]|jgi:hypothetical protein|nr:hypothetical protein [candidate division Zixibacteria bacterium]